MVDSNPGRRVEILHRLLAASPAITPPTLDQRPPAFGSLAEIGSGGDKNRLVGDENPQNPLAVPFFFETNGVIKVLGIRRIDGDDPRVCDILAMDAGRGFESFCRVLCLRFARRR